MHHLDDSLLDAWLDSALAPERRAEVENHLAACSECAARAARMRALFAAIEALPDAPLERDLSRGVVARLRRPAVSPALPWVFGLQAVAAAALLAGIAPIVALSIQTELYAQPWSDLTVEMITAVSAEWQTLLAGLSAELAAVLEAARGVSPPSSSIVLWGLVAGAAGLAWLIGNGAILRAVLRPSRTHRRNV